MTRLDYAKLYSDEHRAKGRHPGYSIRPYVADIAALVERHQPKRILDYGCGKGFQYLARRVHDEWGGLLPHCYDVGVGPLSARPEGKFGGIICTDVLEHIHELDLPEVLEDIFSFLEPNGFVLFGVSVRKANKKFKHGPFQGQNLHLNVRPPEWWEDVLLRAAPKGADIVFRHDGAECV